MSTTTREPFDAFTPLREAVGRFMEEGFVSPERALFAIGRTFPVDVIETAEEFVIEASLLGVKPEDVQITTADNTVTIRAGQKVREYRERDVTYLKRERLERLLPQVSRTIVLPARFDPEQIAASYEHGVLTIRIPKTDEAKVRTIPIQMKEVTTAH
jgi:HSP20 family protein